MSAHDLIEPATWAVTTLSAYCGHHCGTANGRTGHCWCPDCHDGEPGYVDVEADGCEHHYDMDGNCVGGVYSETHEPRSHVLERL